MAIMRRMEGSEINICGFSIDIQMIPTKVGFFLMKASQGTIYMYINAFLVSLGLTATEAGCISGISYIISTIAGPMWGMVADYTAYRRLIYVILCFGLASSVFSLPWVAKEIKFSTCMKSSKSDDARCYLKLTPFASSMFYAMSANLFVVYIFFLPLKGYFDSIVMNILKNTGTRSSFGEQRMFGSLGFGVGNFISGVAADHYYDTSVSKYTPIFFIYLPLILVMVPLGLFLFTQTSWEPETIPSLQSNNSQDERKKKSKLEHLRETFGNLDAAFVMISVLIAGIIRSIALSFLYLTMSDEMNAPKSAMGFAMVIGGISEIIMFPFTKKIINTLGKQICMELGLLAWLIRILTVSYLKNPWLVAVPQALQSIAFALFIAAVMEYIQLISPGEIYVTMFSITYSTYYGASGFLGNMAGGILYQKYGGPALFQATAVAGGVWLSVMFVYFHIIGFIKSKREINH